MRCGPSKVPPLPGRVEIGVGESIESGVGKPLKPGRAWRIIAGTLTPSQATVPDGPDCQWKGGEYERIEAKNRAALKAAEQAEIEASGYFTEPGWREVVSPDGVLCFVIGFAPSQKRARQDLLPPMPDDLSILEFLDRRSRKSPAMRFGGTTPMATNWSPAIVCTRRTVLGISASPKSLTRARRVRRCEPASNSDMRIMRFHCGGLGEQAKPWGQYEQEAAALVDKHWPMIEAVASRGRSD
jgi:hypothetical protein